MASKLFSLLAFQVSLWTHSVLLKYLRFFYTQFRCYCGRIFTQKFELKLHMLFLQCAIRKHSHCNDLCSKLRNQYNRVKFINLSVGASGVLGRSSRSFGDFISNDWSLEDQKTNHLIEKISACCIRFTYYY